MALIGCKDAASEGIFARTIQAISSARGSPRRMADGDVNQLSYRTADRDDQFFQFPFLAAIRYQYLRSAYEAALAAGAIQVMQFSSYHRRQ
jgi:hypothetical protein